MSTDQRAAASPSTSGCGGRATATAPSTVLTQAAAAPCRGASEGAAAAGACWDPAATSQALTGGAGCCG